MTDTPFTREIRITPAYDYRDELPGNRGAHGAELVLVLRGPLGAITANIMTGWMPAPLTGSFIRGRTQDRAQKPGVDAGLQDAYPSGASVAAHCPVRRQHYFDDNGPCDILGTEACYGDGSFSMANEVLKLLVTGGSDAAFDHLETLYQSWIVQRPVPEEAPA